MKICLISGAYPPTHCGVGDHVAALAQALQTMGAEVTVLTTTMADQNQNAPDLGVKRMIESWGVRGLEKLLSAIAALHPEVVHLHYPSTGYGRGLGPNLLLSLLRKRCPKIRCVITLHEYTLYSRLGRWRLLPSLLASHRICCTNHLDRRCLRQQHRGFKNKIRVIPLGSNLESGLSEPTVSATGWLAHFGTVMPNKGWEVLIPALRQLHRQGNPIGVRVAGELAPDRFAYHRKIQRMIQQAGLNAYVDFSGYLPPAQAAARLQTCTLGVLPFREGARLNRSSLVAMLTLGLAVITTQPEHPLEGLRHGQHYWTVPLDNPDALAQAIANLTQNPKLVAQLQQGARQAGERFAWPRIARQMMQVYRS